MAKEKKLKVRHLGHISLGIAASGLVGFELVYHLGFAQGIGWQVVRTGLEAATVGALADYYAVTALFHEVRIPLIRRHTNLVVKNYDRITQGIKTAIVEKFLSAEQLDKLIQKYPPSQAVISYFDDPTHLLNTVRTVIKEASPSLENPQLGTFITQEVKQWLSAHDPVAFLVKWLPKAFERNYHFKLVEIVADIVRDALRDDEIRVILVELLEDAARSYKHKGWWKKVSLGVLEGTKGIDYREIIDSLVEQAGEALKPGSDKLLKMQQFAAEQIVHFSEELAKGNPRHVRQVREIYKALLAYEGFPRLINDLLLKIRAWVQQAATRDDSSIMSFLTGRLQQFLDEFKRDEKRKAHFDSSVKNILLQYVSPEKIGGIVMDYFVKIGADGLRKMLEENFGDDLQMIRLNGAIVGGMVGIILGLLRWVFL